MIVIDPTPLNGASLLTRFGDRCVRTCGTACAARAPASRSRGAGGRDIGIPRPGRPHAGDRSEEHTSELQSLMRISYAVFCLKKTSTKHTITHERQTEFSV